MAIWLSHPKSAGMPADAVAVRVGASRDVLPASEFGRLSTLDAAYRQLAQDRVAILTSGEAEAAQIVARAEAQAADILRAAKREHEQAAAQGYAHGEQRAIADWLGRVAETGDARMSMQARMRERLAAVVSVAVEKIVAVEQRDLLFERALAEVDRIADGATYLNVRVHPTDYAQAQSAFARLAERWRELGQAFPIAVASDKELDPGSCIAESDVGVVDAGLQTQLEAMRGAVSRAVQRTHRASAEWVDTTDTVSGRMGP